MRKWVSLIFSTLLLVGCVPANAPAQTSGSQDNGPSLQDTAKWIVDNLARSGGDYTQWHPGSTATSSGRDSNIKPSFNSCILTYSRDHTVPNNIHAEIYATTEIIPLGAISQIDNTEKPDNLVQWSVPHIYLWTDTQAITISDSHNQNSRSNLVIFFFALPGQDNVDLANRMVKALTRARDLCKSSYNSHPGEPF